MIDILFLCIGMLTLLFMAVCIFAVVQIAKDAKAERQRKKNNDDFYRRLP